MMVAGVPRLLWVTDRSTVEERGFLDRVREAVEAAPGCGLQLRAHGLPARRFWAVAVRLNAMLVRARATLWVNDRIDVALCVRAGGVHLGARSLPVATARRLVGRSCGIGCSTHAPQEVEVAFAGGANLAILGSIYRTASHPDRAPLGLEAIRSASGAGPVLAIGGVTAERVGELIAAGAWGVAVRSGLWSAVDVGAAARAYQSAISAACGAEVEVDTLPFA